MTLGKVILCVFITLLCAVGGRAGERVYSYPILSTGAASVSVGGEVRVDVSSRTAAKGGDPALRGTNLRVAADVHPNIKALLKLDLSSQVEINGGLDELVEEAMLVMSAVGGTGIGFFAGRGRAPYGQDVTLGMLQSYHHAADAGDSSEGRVFIVDPSPGELPPMRPGQLDRVLAAGVSYEWEDRWKVEVAAFQPDWDHYDPWLKGRSGSVLDNPSGLGGAARVWWMPFEDFVLQASAMVLHSGRMAEAHARGAESAKAVSVGFDYRDGPWRVFGEYQRGWDWGFSDGYATDTWQAGAAYDFAPGWRFGGMVEGLRAGETKYHKGVLNLRRSFESGVFVLAEYGYEKRKRHADKTFGHFVGMRVGFTF